MHAGYGTDLMDIAAGGHLNDSTVQWINDRATQLRSTISSTANTFFEQARSMHQMISASDAMQALRNLTAKATSLWSSNQIHRIRTMEEMQTANPVNQRYLMAHIPVREMYLANSIEGYGDSYTNLHGTGLGNDHYDFRRVMNGIITPVVERSEVTQYHEILKEGDKELSLHEKVDIINNWNLLNNLLDEDELDPTSPIGNIMG